MIFNVANMSRHQSVVDFEQKYSIRKIVHQNYNIYQSEKYGPIVFQVIFGGSIATHEEGYLGKAYALECNVRFVNKSYTEEKDDAIRMLFQEVKRYFDEKSAGKADNEIVLDNVDVILGKFENLGYPGTVLID